MSLLKFSCADTDDTFNVLNSGGVFYSHPASPGDIIWWARDGIEDGTENVVNDRIGTIDDALYVNRPVCVTNGVSDYCVLDIASVPTASTGMLSFWIKPAEITTSNKMIYSARTADQTERFYFYRTTDRIWFEIRAGGVTQQQGNATVGFVAGEWAYIEIIQNGVALDIKKNGVSKTIGYNVTTDKTSWFHTVTPTHASIGAHYVGGSSCIAIELANVNINDHALFPMEENSGDIAYDKSGNGNHGTWVGTIANIRAGRADVASDALLNGFTGGTVSTGVDQYIDTGFVPDENTSIELTCGDLSSHIHVGVRQGAYDFFIQGVATGYAAQFGDTFTAPEIARTSRDVVILNKDGLSINGVNTAHEAYVFGAFSTNMYLLAANSGGSAFLPASGNYFRLRVTDSGTLIRDMVPYGDGQMYDRVNDVVYSAGAGTLETLQVPADTSAPTKDVLGGDLTNLGGDTHNGAIVDVRQDDNVFKAGTINRFSADGTTIDDVTWATLEFHYNNMNGSYNFWLKKTDDNHYEYVQYDFAKSFVPAEIRRNEEYFGGTSGTLRNEDGDYVLQEDGYVVFTNEEA